MPVRPLMIPIADIMAAGPVVPRAGRAAVLCALLAALPPASATAQAEPGAPWAGGGPLPPITRDAQDIPAAGGALPPRTVPSLPAGAALPGAADPAGLGVVTHVPAPATLPGAGIGEGDGAEPPRAAPPAPRAVGPIDTRVRVTDTTVWPARAAGLLVAEFGGLESYCSAALVGPSSVLTAAHCVYDPALGWAVNVRFVPGANGAGVMPHGAWPVAAMHVPTGFLAGAANDYGRVVGYDMALLTLGAPVGGALGWFGYGPAPDLPGAPATAPGGDSGAVPSQDGRRAFLSYPADKPMATLWRADCTPRLLPASPALVAHDCPTFAGASGGPMFTPGAPPRITAVNVAETPEHNLGVSIGPEYAAWLDGVWR
jgi:V8-like Glu-specific endopeptidase